MRYGIRNHQTCGCSFREGINPRRSSNRQLIAWVRDTPAKAVVLAEIIITLLFAFTWELTFSLSSRCRVSTVVFQGSSFWSAGRLMEHEGERLIPVWESERMRYIQRRFLWSTPLFKSSNSDRISQNVWDIPFNWKEWTPFELEKNLDWCLRWEFTRISSSFAVPTKRIGPVFEVRTNSFSGFFTQKAISPKSYPILEKMDPMINSD